jgi:hypothetical protein
MLQSVSAEIRRCYEHAEECARQAEAITDDKLRADYLFLESSWLNLARSYEHGERLKLFSVEILTSLKKLPDLPKRQSTRYFFIIQTPTHRLDDDAGISLSDDQSALAHAEAFILDLKSDEASRDCRGWVMIVQDAAGRSLASIPF